MKVSKFFVWGEGKVENTVCDKFQRGVRLLVFLLVGLGSFSCTRAQKDTTHSTMLFDFSKRSGSSNAIQGLGIPVGFKACYGVLVSGPGIAPIPNICGNSYGIYGGFIEEGQSISLSVPRGGDRKVEVLMHLVPEGNSCVPWNMRFGATDLQLNSTYMVGTVAGVNLNSETVYLDIGVSFPGVEKNLKVTHLAQSCLNPLRGQLLSNGDILGSTGLIDDNASHPTNDSYFGSFINSIMVGIGVVTNASEGNVNASTDLAFPSYVYSVTSKPDSGLLYGLVGDGKIVQLTFNGVQYETQELTAATCPFALATCEVPLWTQSISAGMDQDLFMLDHGGVIYKVFPNGTPVPTGDVVGENVSQVTYY